MTNEIKVFALKMDQVEEESGIFHGYASTFGNIDHGDDVVEPGAFRESLSRNQGKVPILDHHDPAKQIGWNMKAHEDERGLFVEGQLNLQVQSAKEKLALMKQAVTVGGRMGLSIGFSTVDSSIENGIRFLKELELFEYSVVTFPMNPQASVTDVKKQQESVQIVSALKTLQTNFEKP